MQVSKQQQWCLTAMAVNPRPTVWPTRGAQQKKGSATVTFQDGMKVTAKKDTFLANTENKKRFIAML